MNENWHFVLNCISWITTYIEQFSQVKHISSTVNYLAMSFTHLPVGIIVGFKKMNLYELLKYKGYIFYQIWLS